MSTSIVIHPISVAGVRFPLAVRSTAPNIRDLDIDISVGECVGCESYYGINLNWIRWFSQQLRSIFGIKVNVVRACKFLHKIYTKVHAQICAGLRANGWGSNFFKIKSFESFADKIFYRGKSVTDAFRQYTEHSQHHELVQLWTTARILSIDVDGQDLTTYKMYFPRTIRLHYQGIHHEFYLNIPYENKTNLAPPPGTDSHELYEFRRLFLNPTARRARDEQYESEGVDMEYYDSERIYYPLFS